MSETFFNPYTYMYILTAPGPLIARFEGGGEKPVLLEENLLTQIIVAQFFWYALIS